MELLFRYETPPGPCEYLAGQTWRYEHVIAARLSAAEYQERLHQGWRRFGHLLFRPRCPNCTACRSLRVDVARFRPSRSQRRNRKLNEGSVRLSIGPPAVTRAKLDLYDRYHAHQAEARGWPQHPARDAATYIDSFVHNPFPIEEWCYYVGDRLVGVGYVDHLPGAPSDERRASKAQRSTLPEGGLSAIYFFYDPDERHRSLGTWNVLRLIEEAGRRRLPYVYLGYYVAGCPSMAYKTRFTPNQVRGKDGVWRDFYS